MKFAVFGNPIEQSRSPDIHHGFAKQFDLQISYERMLVPRHQFNQHVQAFFADPEAVGINVTLPFKEDAYKLVDMLDESAKHVGAVNTIFRIDDQLVGYNTDGLGLVDDLVQQKLLLPGANVLLLGAGGAAKGALHSLITTKTNHIHVVNRTIDKAESIIHMSSDETNHTGLSASCYQSIPTMPFDLVINATSLSLQGVAPVLPKFIWDNVEGVYDMVYGSEPTIFMQKAAAKGVAHISDGLGMLVYQAAEAFRIWTGLEPNSEQILTHLRQRLQKQQ